MERRNTQGVRGDAGGIVSLARFAEENGEALNFDLFTRTGYSVRDIGDAIPWGTFRAFVQQIGFNSAIARKLYPEYADWATPEKTNALLADIYDLLSVINANLLSIGSGKRAKHPKPYPRPGAKKDEEKKIGRGALPHDELVKWFEQKRRSLNER